MKSSILNLFIAILVFIFCALTPLHSQNPAPADLSEIKKILTGKKNDSASIDLLLKVAKEYILKPGEEKPDMDSALLLTQHAAVLSRQLNYTKGIAGSLLNLAINYREMGQATTGKQYADSAILLCRQFGFSELLGESWLEQSQYFDPEKMDTNDWIAAKVNCYQNAFAAFQQSGNKERQGFCMKNMADFSQIAFNFPLAISQARQALELYKLSGSNKVQGCYDLLNYCHNAISDYPSAIKYGLLALQAAEKAHDTTMQLSTIYNRLGLAFARSKTNDAEALRYHQQAYAIAEKYNALPNLYAIAANVVNVYNAMNRPAEALQFARELIYKHPGPKNEPGFELAVDRMFLSIHNNLKNYGEAKKRCDRMEINYIKTPDNNTYGIHDVIRFYLATRQYENAEAALIRFDTVAAHNKRMDMTAYINNLLLWFKLDSSRGNFPAAIAHLQKSRQLQDSVYNDNKSKIIETLRVEYEMENKDKDIALKKNSIELLTATGNLQKEALKRSALVRNITIAGIAVLILFLFLLYRQYRQKLQTNRQVSQQNNELQHLVKEKEWLLKEIHHRVKNNLQTVVSLLESQSAYLKSDALAAIQDSQNRVQAMSLVHQKLYQSDNVASINMAQYLHELISYLKDSYYSSKIHFTIRDIADVDLDVSQAIPVGLIVNEAVSNAIKYAFPEPLPANEIIIELRQTELNELVLTVTDNGVGLPAGFNPLKSGGLGMRLINGLTEDIGGTFFITATKGTAIQISFEANTPLNRSTKAAN